MSVSPIILFCKANQVAHIVCGGCRITLMYAYGAQSVKCAMCNNVTQVPLVRLPNAPATATTAASSTNPSPVVAAPTPKTTVVVENPPSLDDEGNEVFITMPDGTFLAYPDRAKMLLLMFHNI